MVTNDSYAQFSQRLNATLDHVSFPPKGKARQSKLGELFGVGQKGARKWLESESIPRQSRHHEFIEKLNEKGADITGEWLFYGDQTKAPDWYKHLMGINDAQKGEYEVPEKPVNTETKQNLSNIDISNLMPITSPATQEMLKTLDRGLQQGQLSEDDIKLLEGIAKRFMNDKNRKNR